MAASQRASAAGLKYGHRLSQVVGTDEAEHEEGRTNGLRQSRTQTANGSYSIKSLSPQAHDGSWVLTSIWRTTAVWITSQLSLWTGVLSGNEEIMYLSWQNGSRIMLNYLSILFVQRLHSNCNFSICESVRFWCEIDEKIIDDCVWKSMIILDSSILSITWHVHNVWVSRDMFTWRVYSV